MSAGLDASTVTPGKTAPDGSLTVPAMVPSTCAALTLGTLRSPRPRSRTARHSRTTLRIGIRITSLQGAQEGFSLCESVFPIRTERIRLEPGAVKAGAMCLFEEDDSCYDSSIGDVLNGLSTVVQSVGLRDHRLRIETSLLDQLHEPWKVAHHV